MEKIFWVENDKLSEVNSWLQKGGHVKMIVAVPNGKDDDCGTCAYVVMEVE